MPHNIRLFSNVSDRKSMFDQHAKAHREKQLINPFSQWDGASGRKKLSRDDPEYGRPVAGSRTDERGRQAQLQMTADMVELCDLIYDCGIKSDDGRGAICFGDVFRLYSTINDKCVGLLMRGRKHKILDFEGEMLFQRRDDDKMIELLLPLNTIRHKYGLHARPGCGEVRLDLLPAPEPEPRPRARSEEHLAAPTPLHHKSKSMEVVSGESGDAGAAGGVSWELNIEKEGAVGKSAEDLSICSGDVGRVVDSEGVELEGAVEGAEADRDDSIPTNGPLATREPNAACVMGSSNADSAFNDTSSNVVTIICPQIVIENVSLDIECKELGAETNEEKTSKEAIQEYTDVKYSNSEAQEKQGNITPFTEDGQSNDNLTNIGCKESAEQEKGLPQVSNEERYHHLQKNDENVERINDSITQDQFAQANNDSCTHSPLNAEKDLLLVSENKEIGYPCGEPEHPDLPKREKGNSSIEASNSNVFMETNTGTPGEHLGDFADIKTGFDSAVLHEAPTIDYHIHTSSSETITQTQTSTKNTEEREIDQPEENDADMKGEQIAGLIQPIEATAMEMSKLPSADQENLKANLNSSEAGDGLEDDDKENEGQEIAANVQIVESPENETDENRFDEEHTQRYDHGNGCADHAAEFVGQSGANVTAHPEVHNGTEQKDSENYTCMVQSEHSCSSSENAQTNDGFENQETDFWSYMSSAKDEEETVTFAETSTVVCDENTQNPRPFTLDQEPVAEETDFWSKMSSGNDDNEQIPEVAETSTVVSDVEVQAPSFSKPHEPTAPPETDFKSDMSSGKDDIQEIPTLAETSTSPCGVDAQKQIPPTLGQQTAPPQTELWSNMSSAKIDEHSFLVEDTSAVLNDAHSQSPRVPSPNQQIAAQEPDFWATMGTVQDDELSTDCSKTTLSAEVPDRKTGGCFATDDSNDKERDNMGTGHKEPSGDNATPITDSDSQLWKGKTETKLAENNAAAETDTAEEKRTEEIDFITKPDTDLSEKETDVPSVPVIKDGTNEEDCVEKKDLERQAVSENQEEEKGISSEQASEANEGIDFWATFSTA